MKSDFLNYIQSTFQFSPEEMAEFEAGLSRPLKKSLRVNTNKVSLEVFKDSTERKWWQLSPTEYGKNLFYIDRSEDLDRALWHTLEHIAGQFYIQEVAASSSPFYLSNDTIDTKEYRILDMSASPGGKTTQLAEYFPNSTIVANEIDKSRLKQLGENIDRMGATQVLVTNYDGRNFKNYGEFFDKILLDAPCSWEWTAFKTDEALKWWNLRNIESIARLQKQLIESAFIALKVGGEMVYSTCTLNRMENEEVIEYSKEKFWASFEVIPLVYEESNKKEFKNKQFEEDELDSKGAYSEVSDWEENEIWERNAPFFNSFFKRNWPHKNHTGGFFVAKIKKVASCQEVSAIKFTRQNIEKLQSKQEKMIIDFFLSNWGIDLSKGRFYKYGDEVSYSTAKTDGIWEKLFIFKTGISLWTIKWGVFEPSFFAGVLVKGEKNFFELTGEEEGKILRGFEIETQEKDGWVQLIFNGIPFGFTKIKGGKMKSPLPKNMIKK